MSWIPVDKLLDSSPAVAMFEGTAEEETVVELRRYPRIPYAKPGALEIGSGEDATVLRVRFESISCQGAGVKADRDDVARVSPGSRVNLYFEVHEAAMAIPARVVWAAGTHVGLRLLLGSLADDERTAYASWIVPLTNRAIVAARR